jgi:hypothetical protein
MNGVSLILMPKITINVDRRVERFTVAHRDRYSMLPTQ